MSVYFNRQVGSSQIGRLGLFQISRQPRATQLTGRVRGVPLLVGPEGCFIAGSMRGRGRPGRGPRRVLVGVAPGADMGAGSRAYAGNLRAYADNLKQVAPPCLDAYNHKKDERPIGRPGLEGEVSGPCA